MCSCHTKMEIISKVMHEHFVHAHPTMHLEEFQCLYCDEGFDEIAKIREHMFESHPSKFLLIGARRSSQKNISDDDDDDNIQIVYIGDSKKYSSYKLLTCVNREALNSMDPMDLNPHNLYKARQMQNAQYSNIAVEFSGPFPAISFSESHKKEINFITYEKYQQKSGKNKQKPTENVQSKQNSKQAPCNALKVPKRDKQNTPIVTQATLKSSIRAVQEQMTPTTSTGSTPQRKRSPNPIPSTSKQHQSSTTVAPSVAKPLSTPTKISTEYICIPNEIYEDLMSSHKVTGYQSRLCCLCTKFFKIENETEFQKYFMHLKREHACKDAESMRTAKELFDHRLKYHRTDPIVALKIEKCQDDDPENQWLVHQIINARFQCKSCATNFNSIKDANLHNAQHHRGIFEHNEIVFESTVIKSTDSNQPIYSTSKCEPLILLAMFKCDRCKPFRTFRQKSHAVQHHNQYHSNFLFEISLKKFVVDNPPANIDMECSTHPEYLFKCIHCKFYFAALAQFERHDNCDGHARDPQFQMERMVKCAHDTMIGTFQHVKCHNGTKHSGKPFTPVNLFHPNQCGLCESKFENLNELNSHYQMNHPNILSESITNELLDSVEMREVSVGECYYTPGCCCEFKCKGIDQIVQHVSVCNRRFGCTQCSDMPKLPNLTKFIEHCQNIHGQTKREIFSNLHNLKHFSSLLSDLHVIFPNGLHVTVDKIADTDFYVTRLMPCVTEKASVIFKREERYHLY